MNDNKIVRNPNGHIFEAAVQLAEQELDCVVGGYIGETEKNLRPIREAGFR